MYGLAGIDYYFINNTESRDVTKIGKCINTDGVQDKTTPKITYAYKNDDADIKHHITITNGKREIISDNVDNDIIKITGGQIHLSYLNILNRPIQEGAVYLLSSDFTIIQSMVNKIGKKEHNSTQQPREHDSTVTPVNESKFLFDGVTIIFYTSDGKSLGTLIGLFNERDQYSDSLYEFTEQRGRGISLSDIYIKNKDKPTLESAYERFMINVRADKIIKLKEYINTYNVNINKFKMDILTKLGDILT